MAKNTPMDTIVFSQELPLRISGIQSFEVTLSQYLFVTERKNLKTELIKFKSFNSPKYEIIPQT